MTDNRKQLMSLSFAELNEYILSLGEGKYRAKQIYDWLTRGFDFSEMTNLSKALREKLSENCEANPVSILSSVVSALDGTEKYLYALPDSNIIEGVRMRYHYGDTLCISTQVGCNMGCAFCASTLDGRVRNLTAGEMLGQIICVNRRLHATDANQSVRNVVMMGSGEPLDNYDNSIKFLRLLNAQEGLNISLRNVSLSTCGLVPNMYKLADEGLPVTLCVSLHAPNDVIREKLMPVARAYSIDDILKACRNYISKTGRRVIFEYALVKGVNCELSHADELASRLRGMQCHVNLIPLNGVKERQLFPPDESEISAFLRRLEDRHVSATRRREMGDDIQGACGQLRRFHMQNAAETDIRR